MRRPTALIFDMDGVLFLSAEAHARAYRDTLEQEGITGFDYGQVAGMRTDEAFRQILTQHRRRADRETVERLTAAKRAAARRLLREAPPVVDGCRALLRSLGNRFRLALASSSSPENVRLFLEKAELRDEFEVVLDGNEVERAKPDPEIYLEVAKRLGLSPELCLVVEDSETGVRAARAAGMPVVGVVGTLTRPDLESLGVDRTLGSVDELGELE